MTKKEKNWREPWTFALSLRNEVFFDFSLTIFLSMSFPGSGSRFSKDMRLTYWKEQTCIVITKSFCAKVLAR